MKKLLIILLLLIIKINAQVDNKFENDLLNKAAISVTIGGSFIVNGSFPAGLNERVDQFVSRLFNSAKDKLLSTVTNDQTRLRQIYKEIDKYSFRNILLKRNDGKQFNIDLLKFRVNGDFVNNPYLKNDDVIIFQPTDVETNFFSVSGAVNAGGKFPFVEGDKLSDALELAGGLNKAYNIEDIEISRLSYDANTMEVTKVKVNENFTLQRGDRIVVKANETLRRDFNVTVIGEVNSPGYVPITRNKTTLNEVIQAVGGIKETASLKKARIFTGNSIDYLLEKEFEVKLKDYPGKFETDLSERLLKLEDMMMLRMSNVTTEDSAYLLLENQMRIMTEGAALDFTQINDPNSDASKYRVKNGDVIIIPHKINTVYVFGQVPEPGHIPFVGGSNVEYYINKAGGFGVYSIPGEVMIIKGSSRSWIPAKDKGAAVEEGDYIFVPREIQKSFYQNVLQASTYVGIIGSIATVVLLLYQLTKKQ